ncbi:MAG: ABC transporter ATP-binding protein [Campylobacterales bacterium]|nr:ABC transporter ATP-binding protein [Campylobacterales bacterium]
MSKDKPLIEFRDVKKFYGEGDATTYALKGIDLVIEKGEFVAVMGPSGSGKSTMMNIVGSLDLPSGGSYLFDGVDVGSLDRDQLARLRRHYLGFIFQGFNLLAKTTALENVELPLIYRGIGADERKKLSLEALDKVGLLKFAHHTPAQLSGGQQQRVAIARSIVTNPKILLADEPTGNLDTPRSVEIMELLQKFNKEQGITIIMVTHENDMAEFASRIIHFKDGEIDAI